VPDYGDKGEARKPVSIEDLKAMEETLRFSMDPQMVAMRECLAKILKLKSPPTIPLTGDSYSLFASKAPSSPSNRNPQEEDEFPKNNDSSASSQKVDGGKEYHEEKWRSPDPPISPTLI
jgi:hypothetical protein